MFSFIKRFIKKTPVSEDELFTTDFSSKNAVLLFEEEAADGFRTCYDNGFNLEISRKDTFAWSTEKKYEVKDMVLEGVLDFTKIHQLIPDSENLADKAGYTSFGFIFRYINDQNFYSVLISDGGFFRFDVFFNGSQIPIIGWTTYPKNNSEDKNIVPVKIIANGTKFCIVINKKTCVTCEDDTIQSEGLFGFAGQNYQCYEKVNAALKFISMDKRDIYVDSAYRQWSSEDETDYEQNLTNAESFAAIGKYLDAILELEKAWKKHQPVYSELLFGSRLCLAENLNEKAHTFLKEALKLNETDLEVQEQYTSFLYVTGKAVELEKYLLSIKNNILISPLLSSFQGHVLVNSNNYAKAIEYYKNAFQLQSDEPLHLINIANCYDALKNKNEAADTRLKALDLLIAKKNYSEYLTQLDILENTKLLKNQKTELQLIKAKYFFDTKNYFQCEKEITEYLNQNPKNSYTRYMKAVCLKEKSEYKKAVLEIENAIELENNCALYYELYAELLYGLEDYTKAQSIIEKACELNPKNAGSWNLAASVSLKNNDLNKAKEQIFTALSVEPENLSILKNYIIIMQKLNRFSEALPVLQEAASHSGYGSTYRSNALHLAANLLRDTDNFEEAEKHYKKALTLTPKDNSLIIDYANFCLLDGRVNEADSLISSIYTEKDTFIPVEAARLLSLIASKKGDWTRSSVILQQSIEECSFKKIPYGDLLLDLANLYLSLNKNDKALEVAERMLEEGYKEQYLQIESIINEKTKDKISCSLCNLSWYVPKNITDSITLRLTAEPPDNLPAGNCPECQKIYCIGCAKKYIDQTGRFTCPDCKINLKLQNNGIKYLLHEWRINESN